ncbi:MAG: DNA repair protein RadA [Candidatus Magasanikbacteria bacterium RIFOXYD1_FULL_40_23]|uniref:DNA repair protein RadA n=1 Tax=Candidatus Magasanikbacteria bacterium RIFOXYD1_FULL_40_23 TaxID=1798705 RepID=A0A1F6P988_9BACT|nr:MAG: DNA repair protein RadA [Candidatus Magasanikbacteria bacterium RIFOXYD1_FULL_40_23]
MTKNSSIYNCSNCDAQYTKWTGRCLECGKWGTLVEGQKPAKSKTDTTNTYAPIEMTDLKNIDKTKFARIKTNIEELDRVLGGGLVPGSLILLGGEPGIGKSTLALQLAAILPHSLYISGEESVEQIKLRAERLKISAPTLKLGNATAIENIIETIKQNKECKLVIVDSIQTVQATEIEGESGNINQVRACTTKLLDLAKTSGKIIILIGQVTKEGGVAGPKTLEHLVDAVLYLEGDKYHLFRILRTTKNRFGATDEIGVFSMESHGLEEVKNPSGVFLAGRGDAVPGSTVTCLMEGSRPVLVEIQALVTKTNFGYPQRRASGFDLNRLQVLVGVLSKRAGLPLESYDIFLNVVGGLQAEEPAADLAVILALASAIKNKTISKDIASFGEVGLGGEIRPVSQTEKRLNEIKKMGFKFAITPSSTNMPKISELKIAPVKNVKEVVEQILK